MNLYELLGVDKNATGVQIKSAWRRLASSNHPDRLSGDGHQRMAEINRAYEVLSDPQRRAAYDRTGSDRMVNVAALAEQRLLEMFNAYLDSSSEYSGDAVVQMKQAVQKAARDYHDKQVELRRKIQTVTRRSARLKGPGLLRQIANHKIAQCENMIAQIDDELAIADKVLEMLGSYADAEPNMQQWMTTMTFVRG